MMYKTQHRKDRGSRTPLKTRGAPEMQGNI
jgi:hypothetical protein